MSSIEAYITCPFEKSHRILKARIQTHLKKCRNNYPKNTKVECPFDATHFLDPEEIAHHLSVCPTSGNMKCYTDPLEPKRQVGIISIQESCSLQTNVLNEDWSGDNPTYDPLVASQNKNIIRTAIGLTKSEKKKFKQQERERIIALENNSCNNNTSKSIDTSRIKKSINHEQPLRFPKNAAKAILLCQNDCIGDLTAELKHVSIGQSCSSEKRNVSNVSNSSHSSAESLKTNASSVHKAPLSPEGTSVREPNNKDKKESSDTDAKSSGNLKMKKKVAERKGVLDVNSLKKEENYEGTAIRKDALQQASSKQNSLESRRAINLNPRMPSKLYGEAKKISTGRGFTIAYQYLNKSFAEAEKGKENSELASARGYDKD